MKKTKNYLLCINKMLIFAHLLLISSVIGCEKETEKRE